MGRRWEASQEPDVILQLAAGTANFQIVDKGAYIHGYKQTTCSSELVVVSDVRKSGASPKMRASQGAPKIDGGNPVHTWKIPTLPTTILSFTSLVLTSRRPPTHSFAIPPMLRSEYGDTLVAELLPERPL